MPNYPPFTPRVEFRWTMLSWRPVCYDREVKHWSQKLVCRNKNTWLVERPLRAYDPLILHQNHLISRILLFYPSFQNVPATNKRYLIAVDVDSMSKGPVIGSNFLPPAVAAAAMTMIVARTEQQCQLVVGSEKITPAELTGQMYLNEIIQAVSQVESPFCNG